MTERIPPKFHIFTIGHSNHTLDDFILLLGEYEIDVLVDVRSQPYSRYAPHFNKKPLRNEVVGAGMMYLFLGRELGGRPEGLEFYDREGYVLYWRVAESPLFLEGIRRLEKGVQSYRVAIMCSEENPGGCHRHLLVGRVLEDRGTEVYHIRRDGQLQTTEEMVAATKKKSKPAAQLTLFEVEEEKEEEWKSILSVLPRQARKSSLDD